MMPLFRNTLFLAALALASGAEFGLDCSFPVHGVESTCGDLLGDRKAAYDEFMDGCRDKWGAKGAARCDSNELDRLAMSRRQPQSMVNYTETGFKKMRAPKPLWDLINDYWQKNKSKRVEENWGIGNIYTNNWKAPTYMVGVENSKLRGGGANFKEQIWASAKTTIEEWTGMELKPTSLYGIRVYTEGAVLAPHVDRLPLVSSCIINVDQDLDEDWILEVYDRHDRAVNVTMAPGDMVLYESGSLVHGRPFPLKGRFFANIFVHFEPTGRPLVDNGEQADVDDFYPPYLVPGSPEIENWESRNPAGWKKHAPSAASVGQPEGHVAAALGDMEALRELARDNKRALHAKDQNGWMPLHEAVRAGHMEAVALLVKHGADINAVTNSGGGVSPYYIAKKNLTPEHPVSQYLQSLGAVDIGPEL